MLLNAVIQISDFSLPHVAAQLIISWLQHPPAAFLRFHFHWAAVLFNYLARWTRGQAPYLKKVLERVFNCSGRWLAEQRGGDFPLDPR